MKFYAENLQFTLGNDEDQVDSKCVVNDKSQAFLGSIKELFVWDRILSVTEINDLRVRKLNTNDALIEWFEFRQFFKRYRN